MIFQVRHGSSDDTLYTEARSALQGSRASRSTSNGNICQHHLRGIQIGGRGAWRIGTSDLEDYIAEAYIRTAEGIAAGELKDDVEPEA